jgi:putative membrane protein
MAHAPMVPWWLPLGVVVLGAAAYVAAVVRLRQRGDRWPAGRTTWALVGLGLLAAALLPASVPGPAFPMQVARHLLVSMAAPAALALSAPLTLALRALRPPARRYLLVVLHSGVAGALTWAPVLLVLEIGGMYLYYLTPLYMLAEHVEWLHPLVHVHMFLAGCLLSWFLIGRDPLPTRPRTRTRLLVLFVAAGGHDLMAKLMYAHLLPRGAGSAASIGFGAQIMFYGGDVVEVLLATALLLDWYRRGARALAREERRRAGSGAAVSRRTSHHLTPGVEPTAG